jgi:CelD/BcsL family acetyltransferase involved in cellulose biosynthesis
MTHRRWHHYPDWFESFAGTLMPDPESLRIFVSYSGATPVAVFPLSLHARVIGGVPLRSLEFPEHPHLSICDFAFEKSASNAGLVAAFVDHLRGQAGDPWDVLVVHGVLEDSAAWFSLSESPPTRMFSEPWLVCDYLDNTPFDQRLNSLSKNFRGALRKARNKLNQEQDVQFVRVVRPEELPPAYDEFLDVEASGWKSAAGSAIKSDEKRVAFYRALATGFGGFGASEINLLRVGGKCIAAQFCLKIDRCLYILKIGYDETRSKLAPGNMLLETVVRRALSEGEVDAVNLISDAAWHADWKPQSYLRHTAFVFNTSLRGRAGYLALLAKERLRPLYRRHVKPLVDRWKQRRAKDGSRRPPASKPVENDNPPAPGTGQSAPNS